MELELKLKKALEELRKNEEKKFDQTVDLIVNLQKFDIKRNSLNIFTQVPHKIKNLRVCGFLEAKNNNVETILESEFKKYADKKKIKKLAKQFDFFIAQASLMPKVATTFGKNLGPLGKMPSPQLGIVTNTDERIIKELLEKINKSVKLRTKEPSIKIAVGKQSMPDEHIIDNITTIYNSLLKSLPRQKENIRNLGIKFTMTKPQKIAIR
ncbi:hypothetical protein J4225_03490 [Candidatus Pacearchaeota archaeon]|nr:hypothetical protein [Candidatus Pacearchaeota archaeon]